MIKSMTGFGLSTFSDEQSTITVEVKSLNSKFQDFTLRLPKVLSDMELEWRNLIADKLERGKVSFSVEYAKTGKAEIKQAYNKELFTAYYNELKKLADAVIAPSYDQIFQLALSSPDVIQNNGREEMATTEKEKIKVAVQQAIEKCNQFRLDEGKVLGEKIKSNIKAIRDGVAEVEKLDPSRVEKIRSRIKGNVSEFFNNESFDTNRLEQEIIYYIEKLDINEEKVRLNSHLDYFLKVMESKESNGKKLGFIAQEIGREINTIGSKANDAEMQKHVVMMKEELEKIKEQLNNVL
jgi:uncharacterized protein (TIGR00255 family)